MEKSTILEKLDGMIAEYKRQFNNIYLDDCDHDHPNYWRWMGEKEGFREQAKAIIEAKRLVKMISIIDC